LTRELCCEAEPFDFFPPTNKEFVWECVNRSAIIRIVDGERAGVLRMFTELCLIGDDKKSLLCMVDVKLKRFFGVLIIYKPVCNQGSDGFKLAGK
jgi:hypothetical protein